MNPQWLRVSLLSALFTLFLSTAVLGATFEGSSSGIFTGPTGPPGMVTSGVGTSSFTWGSGSDVNRLTFSGIGSFAIEADTVFSFGTLSYHNGGIPGGSEANSVNLSTSINLTSPLASTQNFTFPFQLINTTNTSDPAASADYVRFVALAAPATFSYGGSNYTLQLLGFGSISGGGFTTVNQFHVYEGYNASANLLGRFTVYTPPSVPEPSTMLLLGSGLVGLAAFARRRMRE